MVERNQLGTRLVDLLRREGREGGGVTLRTPRLRARGRIEINLPRGQALGCGKGSWARFGSGQYGSLAVSAFSLRLAVCSQTILQAVSETSRSPR